MFALGVCLVELLRNQCVAAMQKAPGEVAAEGGAGAIGHLLEESVRMGQHHLDDNQDAVDTLLRLAAGALEADPALRLTASAAALLLAPSSSEESSGGGDGCESGSSGDLVELERPLLGGRRVVVRIFTRSERKQAINVLARAFEKDPRTYSSTLGMSQTDREDATRALYGSAIGAWLQQRPHGCFGAFVGSLMVGVMLLVPPDSDKGLTSFQDVYQQRRMVKTPARRKLVKDCVRLMLDAVNEYTAAMGANTQAISIPFVGVLPQWQGQGVGEKLMEAALSWADSSQVQTDAVCFHLRQVQFLQRFGFKVILEQDRNRMASYYIAVRYVAGAGERVRAMTHLKNMKRASSRASSSMPAPPPPPSGSDEQNINQTSG